MLQVFNTMYTSVLFSIFVLLTTGLVLWKRRRLYYASYQLKGAFALPVIGNLLDLVKNSEGKNTDLTNFRSHNAHCRYCGEMHPV